MKSAAGLKKLRPVLGQTALEAREAMAAELFAREGVRNAMAAAASKGFTFLELKPREAFDLRETAAAKALEEWFGAEGLTLIWELRPGPTSPAGEAAYSAVIIWHHSMREAASLSGGV